jgi:hypothetical protein
MKTLMHALLVLAASCLVAGHSHGQQIDFLKGVEPYKHDKVSNPQVKAGFKFIELAHRKNTYRIMLSEHVIKRAFITASTIVVWLTKPGTEHDLRIFDGKEFLEKVDCVYEACRFNVKRYMDMPDAERPVFIIYDAEDKVPAY